MKNKKIQSNHDLTLTLSLKEKPAEVFAAVNNVRGWWSARLKGKSDALNAEFEFQYENLHYSTQRLVEFIPDRRVVWLVTESRLTFLKKDPAEWTGTRISFDIEPNGNKTELRFTHWGLTPGVECYNACHQGWSHYILHSLKNLITTGSGNPD